MRTMQAVSIPTPFNQRAPKSNHDTRRILVKGRWVRINQAAKKVLDYLKG